VSETNRCQKPAVVLIGAGWFVMSRARFKLKQFSKPLVATNTSFADEEALEEAQRCVLGLYESESVRVVRA
jgi:hypothetical protein